MSGRGSRLNSAGASPLPVVYDCMIFLQGAARPNGPAAACLDLAQEGRVLLHLSAALLLEIRDVLTRPKIQRKYPVLTEDFVEVFLEKLLSRAVYFAEVPCVFHYERDPKDEPYLNLAIAVNAQYIVSRDRDLLDLMDAARADGREFRGRFPALAVVDPVSFLNRVNASTIQ